MALPTFVAAGAEASNAAAITVGLPAGIATDDILLLLLATSNEAIAIANANGGTWTELPSSPQGTGTPAGAAATRLTVFWSRYNGTQGDPTTTDSGDVNEGVILAFRGCITTGDPWNVTSGGVDTVSDTSVVIPGDTTTVADCLVVAITADSFASTSPRLSAWANADLANVTEVWDEGTTLGQDVGVGAATGEKATAGAYGDTTATLAGASVKAFLTIALISAGGGGGGPGQPMAMRVGGIPGMGRRGFGRGW